jgi:hypothetical protein
MASDDEAIAFGDEFVADEILTMMAVAVRQGRGAHLHWVWVRAIKQGLQGSHP